MARRLEAKTAVVIGAGQTPGPTMGNGRATALVFARAGATVLAVDRDLGSAEETAALIRDEGGEAESCQADVTIEAEIQAAIAAAERRWSGIDILHNNVGVSIAGDDAPVTEITPEAFDRVMAINLRSMVLACKHALPGMRARSTGVILNISSISAIHDYPLVAYKASKAAMLALTRQLALDNAPHGIRVNAILPGLMDTPMAVDTRAQAQGVPREDIATERDAQVPLLGKMGTAWDVANAALFLASDEAGFITGACLPVDGGQLCKIG